MLKGIYLICSLLSMVFTLGDFTNVWLLTGGAPGDSTHVCWRRSPTATRS